MAANSGKRKARRSRLAERPDAPMAGRQSSES